MFQYLNLRYAREFKQLTMADLAKKLKISRQTISNYENGLRMPDSQTISLLSWHLEQPVSYFNLELPKENNTIFFRKLSSSTAKNRRVAKISQNYYLRHLIEYAYNYFDLPNKSSLPIKNYSEEEIKNLNVNDIEVISCEVRDFFEIGRSPISNLTMLLENNFIIITKNNFIDTTLDGLSSLNNNIAYISINQEKNKYTGRNRFTLAHELGHLVLHSRLEKEDLESKPALFKQIEEQANLFASAFLLPKQTFSNEVFYPSIKGCETLKARWKVSIQAIIIRMFTLNLITEEKKTSLFKQIYSLGYRKKEPLDETLEEEKPILLSHIIEKIAEQIGYTRIKEELQLSTSIISKLSGIDESKFIDRKSSNIISFNKKLNNA